MKDIKEENISFQCPNCGEISREDVLFLCNKCEQDDLILMDGIYMCPSCLEPGENFQCYNCESTEVTMKMRSEKK